MMVGVIGKSVSLLPVLALVHRSAHEGVVMMAVVEGGAVVVVVVVGVGVGGGRQAEEVVSHGRALPGHQDFVVVVVVLSSRAHVRHTFSWRLGGVGWPVVGNHVCCHHGDLCQSSKLFCLSFPSLCVVCPQ
jgi:hypothetical protein